MEFDGSPGFRLGAAWQHVCGWEVGGRLTVFNDEAFHVAGAGVEQDTPQHERYDLILLAMVLQ